MTRDEVVALMESCQSEEDWKVACRKVKASCDGTYPPFWFEAILQSGLGTRVSARWGGDMEIRVGY